ncbi:hypothetical protein [Leptolyngbya sp. FACHB-261]|uniref:hypothetical protein n=1 Tax=Leptolyngbya sp. FACHB-261 TaxID=2692806 RepID=UPI00168635DE|nr:hypothetical protein [Leptolyngbya sp. FACHB-261]MBD2103809.1 hypothetical protein [Leptolyngbya sp. FACHB-261]
MSQRRQNWSFVTPTLTQRANAFKQEVEHYPYAAAWMQLRVLWKQQKPPLERLLVNRDDRI